MHAADKRFGWERLVGCELDPVEAEASRDDPGAGALEDAELRVAVRLEGAVAVEVVRLEVQENGDLAGELVDVFELEARELADDPGPRLDLAVEVGQRAADVPGDRCLQHDAEQLAGGRLAVRPRYAEDPGRQQAVAELDLAPDRYPAALGLGDERNLAWNSGALDEHVGAVEQRQVAVVPELTVGANDVHSAPLQRRRGRLPRAREPEHKRLSRQVVH